MKTQKPALIIGLMLLLGASCLAKDGMTTMQSMV
jgi:hypothetical protein